MHELVKCIDRKTKIHAHVCGHSCAQKSSKYHSHKTQKRGITIRCIFFLCLPQLELQQHHAIATGVDFGSLVQEVTPAPTLQLVWCDADEAQELVAASPIWLT